MDDHGCVKISFDSCVQNHALVCWMECGSILVVQLRHHVFISRFLFLFFFFIFSSTFTYLPFLNPEEVFGKDGNIAFPRACYEVQP